MAAEDRVIELKILLKRCFPRHQLFEIGKELSLPYFERVENAWLLDEDQAAFEIASKIGDSKLKEAFEARKPREWVTFRGRHFTFEDGKLLLEGSWEALESNLRQAMKKHGKNGLDVLKAFLVVGKGCGLKDLSAHLKRDVDPEPVVEELDVVPGALGQSLPGHLRQLVVAEEHVDLAGMGEDQAGQIGRAHV